MYGVVIYATAWLTSEATASLRNVIMTQRLLAESPASIN